MRMILLTKGLVALVDDEDYERINAHSWYAKFDVKLGGYYAWRNAVDAVGNRYVTAANQYTQKEA